MDGTGANDVRLSFFAIFARGAEATTRVGAAAATAGADSTTRAGDGAATTTRADGTNTGDAALIDGVGNSGGRRSVVAVVVVASTPLVFFVLFGGVDDVVRDAMRVTFSSAGLRFSLFSSFEIVDAEC